MIVLLISASKTWKDLRCLQSAAAKASSSSAAEHDDQSLIINTRGTKSVIGSDHLKEISGKMTQSDKHEQPSESISNPACEEPPLKVCRGRPPNTSPQKLLAEVYIEAEAEPPKGCRTAWSWGHHFFAFNPLVFHTPHMCTTQYKMHSIGCNICSCVCQGMEYRFPKHVWTFCRNLMWYSQIGLRSYWDVLRKLSATTEVPICISWEFLVLFPNHLRDQ